MPVDTPPAVAAVVVQAARLPDIPGLAAYSQILLTPDDLKARERLDEALSQAPGLSLFRRTSSLGANPTTQGVSLRAFAPSGAGRALVTLDGVPQNDPFGGWVIWSAQTPEAMESVLILRGAGAGPYGAGALTGVVAMDERVGPSGSVTADAAVGGLGLRRGGAAIEGQLGPVDLLVSGSAEHDDGWIPVEAGRGPADDKLSLSSWAFATRAQMDIGRAVAAARITTYEEERSSGLVGANSRASGVAGSLTVAAAPAAGELGWRLQGWARSSDLSNTSVSVAPGRVSTTPANNQYKTPAVGWGFNAAARGQAAVFDWEVGADVRGAEGDDHELFRYLNGAFTRNRVTGGRSLVAGAYVEADVHVYGWLVTGGARADYWGDFNGHRLETNVASGAVTLDQHSPDRNGVLPTGRLAARRDFSSFYLRGATYAGFRPPSLNELHRPFRVGNDITESNPSLKPERLYGVEAAAGQEGAWGHWELTAFANQLKDPVTNVTIGVGPGTFPTAGFVPAGGTLRQRQNAGAIDAYGLEGELVHHVTHTFDLRVAESWTHARVDGANAAPQLTGLRPAQAPRLAVTSGFDWRPIAQLALSADVRYESLRFEDDLNTRRLGPATSVDAMARWRFTPEIELYVAADNLFDANVATGQTADGVTSYGPPRVVRVGLSVRR